MTTEGEKPVDELAAKRADRGRDSHLWTPTDALQDALIRVNAEILSIKNLAVVWFEEVDGTERFRPRLKFHYRVSGCNRADLCLLFETAMRRFIDDNTQ